MEALLRDKVVLVTGAGTGVGRALAVGFARDGAKVIGIARTESELLQTAHEVEQVTGKSGRMLAVPGDVSRTTDVETLFTQAEAEFGGVEILVNNAAVYPKVEFLEQAPEDFDRTLLINVGGVARCCRRALPGMLKAGYGRIINIGSFAFRKPIPTAVAYSASKGALSSLSQGIANEIDRERYPNVLVNELMPGVFRTRMTPDFGADPSEAYPFVRQIALLPARGPHGEIFADGQVYHRQPPGLRAKVKGVLRKFV